MFLSVRTSLAHPAERAAPVGRSGLLGDYASTLFLTLTNPTTILSFAAIFASVGAGEANVGLSATMLVPGVFLGSAMWWFVLSGGRGPLPGEALRPRVAVG